MAQQRIPPSPLSSSPFRLLAMSYVSDTFPDSSMEKNRERVCPGKGSSSLLETEFEMKRKFKSLPNRRVSEKRLTKGEGEMEEKRPDEGQVSSRYRFTGRKLALPLSVCGRQFSSLSTHLGNLRRQPSQPLECLMRPRGTQESGREGSFQN